MWSNISKQQVVRVLPDQLIGTHMTIADKQHIAPDIKVKVNFKLRHIKLCIQHTDIPQLQLLYVSIN